MMATSLRRSIATSGIVLVTSWAPAMAQTQASKDPLTGVWSGYLEPRAGEQAAVRVEFKLGANGTVTGTITGPRVTPGDIKSGTYDAATGALKFTVGIRSTSGNNGGNVAFDGRVVRDSATGTAIMGTQHAVFKFAKGERDLTTLAASAKPTDPNDPAAALRRGFIEVSDWITRAAELVPADKYSYRPVGTVRTFGQIVAHVVDGAKYYCGRAAGKTLQWSDATEKTITGKAALGDALKKAFAECTTEYEQHGQIAPLMENVAHSSLHYGNLVTYIRMLGLVPPSS